MARQYLNIMDQEHSSVLHALSRVGWAKIDSHPPQQPSRALTCAQIIQVCQVPAYVPVWHRITKPSTLPSAWLHPHLPPLRWLYLRASDQGEKSSSPQNTTVTQDDDHIQYDCYISTWNMDAVVLSLYCIVMLLYLCCCVSPLRFQLLHAVVSRQYAALTGDSTRLCRINTHTARIVI